MTPAPAGERAFSLPPSELETKLVDQLRSGHTALPVLPAVAASALRLASNPDASVTELAKLVDGDPPIAARFLSVANSAAYGRAWAAANTQAAIARLGLGTTRDLLFQVVYATSMHGLVRHQAAVQASFSRSVTAGLACQALCRELGRPYEYAYMCGLLHDIGEARVYRVLAGMPESAEGPDVLSGLVQRHHATAGAEVARAWRLPTDIVDVCAAHHDETATDAFHVRLTMLADLVVETLASDSNGVAAPPPERFSRLELHPAAVERVLQKMGSTASGPGPG